MNQSSLAAAVIALTLVATSASAAEITFDGYTNGCFATVSCTPGTLATTVPLTLNELTYQPGAFGGTSVGGALSLTLGTFSLAPLGNDTYGGNTFSLRVTFQLPAGVGSSAPLYSSTLTGTTSSAPGRCGGAANAPCGSVTVDFTNNNPVLFSFVNGPTSGSFLFSISDLVILAGQSSVPLAGSITQASQVTSTNSVSVPEPATLTMLGLALAGLGLRRRRG